jgi:hypothetical protein
MNGGILLSKQTDVIIGEKLEGEKVVLRHESRKLNTLVVGPTGSGKEAFIFKPILKQDMKNKQIGITVFDPIGDISDITYALAKNNRRKVIYFHPFLKNVKFNPLRGEKEDVIERMNILIRNHFIDSPQFFISLYERLVRYSIEVLWNVLDKHITIQDIYTFITNPNGKGRKLLHQYLQSVTKEEGTIMYDFFMDYFQKGKMYEYCSGIIDLFYELVSNEKISHIFNTKEEGEFIELDFSSHIQNKEVVIIHIPFYQLDGNLRRILATLLSSTFTTSLNNKEGEKHPENHLYIKELYYFQPGFHGLFAITDKVNVSVMADTQTFSLLTLSDRDYVDNLLFLEFRNFILFPGLSMNDKSLLQKYLLTKEEVDSLYFLENGQFFFYLMDKTQKGYVKKGIAKGLPLTKEENDFFNKRLKRYKKAFQKQMV